MRAVSEHKLPRALQRSARGAGRRSQAFGGVIVGRIQRCAGVPCADFRSPKHGFAALDGSAY